eukprot:GHRR01014436.1.p1 GENE.GHRR01014436.1~~GHRR01014436.1.p1  ORF type:complete len:271 (+),score=80.02 GHRR01014436.1:955-1767(+)
MKPSGRMERNDVVGGIKAMGGDASLAANLGYGYGIQVEAIKPSTAAAAAGSNGPAGQQGARPSSAQQKQKQRSSWQDSRAAAAAGKVPGPGGAGGVVKHKDPPIILVPSGVTAMINMHNAKWFLEEGKFVPSEEAMKANPIKPTQAVEFTRTALRHGPHHPRYQVTDKVPKPGHPDWKRVVAVIAQGKAWQFKGFPFKGADKGELMETFTHLFGAYFHYNDEPVPENVAGWKVVKLPIRRTARHLDQTVMLDFYSKLDAFLQARRCELNY